MQYAVPLKSNSKNPFSFMIGAMNPDQGLYRDPSEIYSMRRKGEGQMLQ